MGPAAVVVLTKTARTGSKCCGFRRSNQSSPVVVEPATVPGGRPEAGMPGLIRGMDTRASDGLVRTG